MDNSLTLKMVKKMEFEKIYCKLLLPGPILDDEHLALLKIAVIFLNSNDGHLQSLGYRIIVLVCLKSNDYRPLYDIAINNGFFPIAKQIELLTNDLRKPDKFLFIKEFQSAYLESFKVGSAYYTDEQLFIVNKFKENTMTNDSSIVVAPTSYGKSELILSSIAIESGNICILVPSKALISQTKRRVLLSREYSASRKIITHAEMFFEGDTNIIAILTQERLIKLLQDFPSLGFSLVHVDEAHNLLEDTERGNLLATALILLQKRNPKTCFKFLTPFLVNSENLMVSHTNLPTEDLRITEKLKIERFYCCDLNNDRKIEVYDQYLDNFFDTEKRVADHIDLILKEKTKKNIIYLNRPIKIEQLSKELLISKNIQEVKSPAIDKICNTLARHIHKEYLLISCIRKGFVYHHGSIPDNIKAYIEYIYSVTPELEIIATTSTLLEGVNIPAETMFLLDNRKGRGNLTPSQFKNLIGRTCRFREIFASENRNLSLLAPRIFVVGSKYVRQGSNIMKFISDSARVDKAVKETPENILLKKTDLDETKRKKKAIAEQFIENIEKGTIKLGSFKYAQTAAGRACFLNSVTEFDVLSNELKIQKKVDELIENGSIADNANKAMELINKIFSTYLKDDENLGRLENVKARSFYSMFLSWRIDNVSYGEMIGRFLGYWAKEEKSYPFIYVSPRWGEISIEGFEGREYWIDIRTKSLAERINMAIIRIKEEQDFLENNLLKFIEVLHDLGLISDMIFYEIKYGTSDPDKILLIKNGISSSLSGLLLKKYRSKLELNPSKNQIVIKKEILEEMKENQEDEILLFEMSSHVPIGL